MKVVILAGGMGTRLAEETDARPKPMVEVGGRPILWHIMKHYAHHGFREFVVALGYKGEEVKRWFRDHAALSGSFTIDLAAGRVTPHAPGEDWTVHLVDTGVATNTGGRVRRLADLLGDETFMLTYGDGVSDVDLGAVLALHRARGRAATLTAVRPPARFGGLDLDGDRIRRFSGQTQIDAGWVNGGFMALEPARVLPYLLGDEDSLERAALAPLAAAGELCAYRHHRFWQCMDTLREKRLLDALWRSGSAPWKVWS